MKKSNLFIAAIGFIAATAILSTSCASNNKEVMFGCDSTNVSYSKTIKTIID